MSKVVLGLKCPKQEDVRRAVDAYNDEPKCGGEDEWCWEKTDRARELVLGPSRPLDVPKELPEYAATIRLWGSIRGVASDDYPRAAVVLWKDLVRNQIHRLNEHNILTAPVSEVVDLEEAVVNGMISAGVERKRYSWSSTG